MKNSLFTHRRWFDAFSLLIFLCAGYFLADRFLFSESNESVTTTPACTLSTTPCAFSSAIAKLAEDTVTPLIPVTLDVTVNDNDAPYLLLEVEGVEMNMGMYKLKLAKSDNNQYRGEVMLPICMDAEMTWRGAISSPDKQILLPIDIRMKR